jgi:Heterokaryon incompatibility protein (HET)
LSYSEQFLTNFLQALSYAIEKDSDDKGTVSIEDSRLVVRACLHQALCRIRVKSDSRLIWVDTLCIDSNNLSEKSIQVALMPEIYKTAQNVLMFVGDPEPLDIEKDPNIAQFFTAGSYEDQDYSSAKLSITPKAEVFDWRELSNLPMFFQGPLNPDEWPVLGAFCIVHYLANDKHLGDMPFWAKQDPESYNRLYAWRKSVLALLDFLGQTYWMQPWTYVAAALGLDPVVYYGNHIISFKVICQAFVNLNQHAEGCCQNHVSGFQAPSSGEFPGWHFVLGSFLTIMRSLKMRMMQGLHTTGTSTNYSLRDALDNEQFWREAEDPRDLVYGVSALILPKEQNPLPIDYNLSVGAVFAQVAIRVFQEDGDLSALAYFDSGRDNDLKLPSWVPDWCHKYKMNPDLVENCIVRN